MSRRANDARLLSFSQFSRLRSGKHLDEDQVVRPKNTSNPLPVLLTFQRKEMRMFSDGRVVGLYREVRTGVEMVFPGMWRSTGD